MSLLYSVMYSLEVAFHRELHLLGVKVNVEVCCGILVETLGVLLAQVATYMHDTVAIGKPHFDARAILQQLEVQA